LPLRWEGVGKAQCPQCGKRWRWADRWQPIDDGSPDSSVPHSSVPQADDAPLTDQSANPDPAPASVAQDEGNDYIATEAWLAQLETEFVAQGEPAPFGNAPPSKEALCQRCGHREVVDAEVLLPPLCPACGATMEWVVPAPV